MQLSHEMPALINSARLPTQGMAVPHVVSGLHGQLALRPGSNSTAGRQMATEWSRAIVAAPAAACDASRGMLLMQTTLTFR